MSQIIHKFPFIVAISTPFIDALTISLIINVIAYIAFAAVRPRPITVTDSVLELTFVDCSVLPAVHAIAFWLAICIEAVVAVAVGENLDPSAMLVAVLDVPFVLGGVCMNLSAAFRSIQFPSALVEV